MSEAPASGHGAPPPAVQDGAEPGGHPFVGRVAELAELENLAADVATSGRARLVLLSGAAGAGKTALARTLTRHLEIGGWTTAWGASPEVRGAPAAWPWTQIREQLTTTGHPPDGGHAPGAGQESGTGHKLAAGHVPAAGFVSATRDVRGSGRGPGAGSASAAMAARFRRHRAVVADLAAVAGRGRPLLLVFDDLHWADEDTLALLTTLATDLGPAPVLILGTYRSTEISAGLADALGRAARTEPARLYLGGLTEPQVHELVQAVTGREVDDADARKIHARSAGNPFFVRELTRLWGSEGDAALRTAVPAGVRDVIRHRLTGLTETARTHLRQAAVLGQDVDLGVLIPLAGDEEQVLESVESALLAGFLVERDADRLRFAHALVHETLYDDVTRARRARWHARAAEIVERIRPTDVETIAHHCVRAEGRADPARTARHTRAAARRAERGSAPREAARLWRVTLTALDRMPAARPTATGAATPAFLPGPADRLDAGDAPGGRVAGGGAEGRAGGGGASPERMEAIMGLVRALAVIGESSESRRYRAEAVD
ncbi:AAA family ATPase [Nonomuraea sp. MG754425]|uniref:AAA family ATPase n=1 Tax=Nonomuraea sp. MG754425 TaxID=2570319 RepID=UPI001F1DC36C|nr:AAA family ATPase [Nonomuraea sp. MG754425]